MTGHFGLALAAIAFVGSHLVLSHPLRPRLIQALGEARFTLFYSVVATAALAWLIIAWKATGTSLPLWVAPPWAWPLAAGLMLLALLLLAGAFVRNPAFPHPGARPKAIPPPKGMFAITRHPMNVAIILWAATHIMLWGSPRNLIIAGAMLILALAGSIGQDRKKRALLGKHWRDWEARTSFVPFAALLAGRTPWKCVAPDWRAVAIGLAAWIAIIWFHAPHVLPVALLSR